MNRFDKPFRIIPTIDQKKSLELFNLVSKLDTHEILQFSLINQIPLDVTNSMGESLIHEVINIDSNKASEHAKLNVIKFLYLNNVDPDKPNKNNQTPLHIACISQLKLIVDYLLEIGVNVNYQDNLGNTPLHYLLTGKIKTIDNYTDVMDFIPPPKKVDTKLRDDTIALKKLIWQLIQDPNIRAILPMLETIQNSINGIITEDSDINQLQIGTQNLITDLATKANTENNLSMIKETIGANRNYIHKKIKNLFGNLSNLDLDIHQKTDTSWSPIDGSQQYLIKDGNVKRVIKRDIQNSKTAIDNLARNFTLINPVSDYWKDNQWEDMVFNHYIDKINRKRELNILGQPVFREEEVPGEDPPQIPRFCFNGALLPNRINEIHDSFKHPLALDYASSIIDFSKLKYVGGPRYIITNIPDDDDNRPFNDLDTLLAFDNEEYKKILWLLGLSVNTINAMDNYDFFDSFFDSYVELNNFWNFNDFNYDANSYYVNLINAGPFDQNRQVDDMKWFVLLAYTAILKPIYLENDNFNTRINQINEAVINDGVRPNIQATIAAIVGSLQTEFPQKWLKLYKERKDIGSWLIEMWCDMHCKFSISNLDCYINYKLLALAAGLNLGGDKIQGVINVLKPQLINLIPNQNNPDEKITKWIMLLLNDSIDLPFLNAIQNGGLLPLPVIPPNLANLYNLILEYINNPNYIPDPNNQYYNTYKKSNNFKENLCHFILLEYNNLRNKPLKQTVLDTIYWFMYYIDGNIVTVDNFNFIKTSIINNNRITNSPSGKSYYNYLYFNNQNVFQNKYRDINVEHFKIAHFMGLYYEGIFEPVNFPGYNDLNAPNYFSFQFINGNGGDYSFTEFSLADAYQNTTYHRLNGDNLTNNNLEFPLKYILLSNQAGVGNALSPLSKYNYYDINQRPFISPTIHSYAHMLLKKIYYYQQEISKLIIQVNIITAELENGRSSDLRSLFIHIYYSIVLNVKILESFIKSFNDFKESVRDKEIWRDLRFNSLYNDIKNYSFQSLANSLNKINASFYLYYYIFSPTNMVKLSKFNYYQIPIDKPVKYEYFYDHNNQDLVNIYNEENPPNPGGIIPVNNFQNLTKGFMNDFAYGIYNEMISEFSNGLPSNMNLNPASFQNLKTLQVPPSLFNHLDNFYKYVLIELIKKLLTSIRNNRGNNPQQQIWTAAENIIRSRGLNIDDASLSVYQLIAKIIEELIKEQIDVYLNNNTFEKYNQIITNIPNLNLQENIIFKTTDMTLNLAKTSINLTIIMQPLQLRNMYNIVLTPNKNDNILTLYPNDLTNINKLRSKYGVEINREIIRSLFNYGASPYINSNDGSTPLIPIIKNYNWRIIDTLKNDFHLDFRDLQNMQLNFIKTENMNNLEKILGLYKIDNTNKPIKTVLSNIDEFLYSDVEMLIKSNQAFGNNILSNLKYSFNLSTYLTLQILSEHLMNISNNFTINNLGDISRMFNIDINLIKSNYWGQVTDSFNLPDNFNIIINRKIQAEKIDELNKINSEISLLKSTIRQLTNNGNGNLARQYRNDHKYRELKNKARTINQEIQQLRRILRGNINLLTNNDVPNGNALNPIDRYNNNYYDIGIQFEVWKKILDSPINLNNINNFNLIPIFIFDKQYQLIDKFNLTNKIDLELIEKTMEHLAKFAENYFSNSKYIKQNIGLDYANNMLNYLTKMTIGNSIELIMRKILFTYYMNSSQPNDINVANMRLDYILEDDQLLRDSNGQQISLLGYLYNEICPKLVKNAVEIFDDKSEEAGFISESIREILLSFFNFLELYNLPEIVIDSFKKEVTNYFDTITGKTILLWYVNFENILKFIINNHRCLKTFLLMM